MRVSDEEVLKYCDGIMSAEDSLRVEKASLTDVELSDRISAMNASDLPYAQAFAQQGQPALPKELLASLEGLKKQVNTHKTTNVQNLHPENTSASSVDRASSWRFAGIAASLAASFFIGYSVSNFQNTAIDQQAELAQSAPDTQMDWVERVANYQTLYVENTVTPILRGAETASTLLARLETTGGLQTAIPDLSEHGYTFVRAQELGFDGKPLVQLVYFKPGVAPLALCYMPSSDARSAKLSISEYERLHTADWIQNGQRFVIVAEESNSIMQSLHNLARAYWS